MLNRFSPLRYPGGKGKLAEYVQKIFNQNDLNDGHYVEPYAGGAGVALALLFMENASHVHINDLNTAVYAFWYSVLNDTEELCKKVGYRNQRRGMGEAEGYSKKSARQLGS
jgi:DNA adenine methylase